MHLEQHGERIAALIAEPLVQGAAAPVGATSAATTTGGRPVRRGWIGAGALAYGVLQVFAGFRFRKHKPLQA